jgi:NADH-quinone oxidoreductase subunit L
MLDLLWAIPVLPLAGFVLLTFLGRRLQPSAIAAIGVGSIGLTAALALGIGFSFLSAPPEGGSYTYSIGSWMSVGAFSADFGLYLDALSMTMTFVITFVGFWIHLFASEYMHGDPSYARFFAVMNLFVCAMLFLVLGDNLPLLFLGWEGVGLCSYLLIGFWYDKDPNARAAVKAFQVTRIGDAAMAVGLYLLFASLGTLEIQPLLQAASAQWAVGSSLALLAAWLLLGGAVGKSAQLPLQVWLPDAMAGPTPVSALIHAATMVTAGVYLIARMHTIFELAPDVQLAVAVVGVATMLLAGFAALAQSDIKRVLAYSTVSQIGYMFIALGVGAWHAAIFHLMTHAFFKALLFLGAAAIIHALHHEQNMFRMGGLRDELPLVFKTFLVGGASLAGLPLITAGFYSKDLILWNAFASGHTVLWLAALLGSFLTGLYTFRMIFLVFFGKSHAHVHHPPGARMNVVLVVLAFFAITAGFLETPHMLGHVAAFSHFTSSALPVLEPSEEVLSQEPLALAAAVAISLAGLAAAWSLFYKRKVVESDGGALADLWRSGWGFDRVYHILFVAPVTGVADANKRDVIDLAYDGVAAVTRGLHHIVSTTQTGRLRWYAASVGLGAILLIALIIRP